MGTNKYNIKSAYVKKELKDSSKNNFPQKTPRKSRGFSSLFKRLCSTDFEHRRTARRTFPLHCRFSVFHSNPCRVRIFSFGAALNAIHRSHSFHPLSKLYFAKIFSPPSSSHQYNIISSPIARTVKKTIFLSPLKIKEGSIRQWLFFSSLSGNFLAKSVGGISFEIGEKDFVSC